MENNDHMDIKVLPNGPMQIKGKFIFKESSGKTTHLNELLLCGCGESRNKPFCDCTHGEKNKK